MTMRGGLTIATGAVRPRFVYARALSPAWLAEVRGLLTADEPGRQPDGIRAADSMRPMPIEPIERTILVLDGTLPADARTR